MKLRNRLVTNDRELRAILRTDFLAFSEKCFYTLYPHGVFAPNFHHLAIAYELLSEYKRTLINAPPRHMKSELASIFYSAWMMGHDPGFKILAISDGDHLARKFNRDVRKIMRASWYKELFPATCLSPDKCTETILETTAGGYRYATTVGGEIVGFGAHLIIIDDPHTIGPSLTDNKLLRTKEWYSETLLSRLDQHGVGRIVVVMQRSRHNDLAGYLLQTGAYHQLCLPLIAPRDEPVPIGEGRIYHRKQGECLHPARTNVEEAADLRSEMGDLKFSALYLQDPKPFGGALFNIDKLPSFPKLHARTEYEFILQCWDCASSLEIDSSYSVCITFGMRAGRLEVLNVWRKRVDYIELRAEAKYLIDQFSPSYIVVENASAGQSLLQELVADYGSSGIIPFKPRADKVSRAESILHLVAKGKLAIPRQAQFLEPLREEIRTFPNGYYDDQVDCLVMALIVLNRKIFRLNPINFTSPCSCDGYKLELGATLEKPAPKHKRLDLKNDTICAKSISGDLLARRQEITDNPYFVARSQRDREFNLNLKVAKFHILAELSRPAILSNSTSFIAKLREIHDGEIWLPENVAEEDEIASVVDVFTEALLNEFEGVCW
jgi:predicted phage terminase large subunit-like protein